MESTENPGERRHVLADEATRVMKMLADTRLAYVLLVSFSCEVCSMPILIYIHFYRDTMIILTSQRHKTVWKTFITGRWRAGCLQA